MMDLFGSKLLMMRLQNMLLINFIFQFILSNTIYNIIKISDEYYKSLKVISIQRFTMISKLLRKNRK